MAAPSRSSSRVSAEDWDTLGADELAIGGKSWSEMKRRDKVISVAISVLKVLAALGLLYLFIISLGLMGYAFKILGGKTAGETFRNVEIFHNPIAGLVLGILVTVLVQSSSTSTSIIISMTAAGLLTVKDSIPMIMGANIGTSVTNTIVSVAQVGDKNQYRRAFAGATVHDCFNLLSVLVLLPIEVVTGLLRHISEGIVHALALDDDSTKRDEVDFLKKITNPLTYRLVHVDKNLITHIAEETDAEQLKVLMQKSIIKQDRTEDSHLFMDTPMSDMAAGWILLAASLCFMLICLILLVKLLQSTFQGWAAQVMKGLLNLEFKRLPGVADYVLICFGALVTVMMQSSSITTSTLTPLVGLGIVKLEKMFPFTVGANIGTTVTGIISAMASSNIGIGMTVALAHLWFNIFGTLIWFPIPMMRRIPLAMARTLGRLAGDLSWFPIAYTILVFGVLPTVFLALSLAGTIVFVCVGAPVFLASLGTVIVLALRNTRPQMLPAKLRADPAWLPESLRIEAAPAPAATAPMPNKTEEKVVDGSATTTAVAASRVPWTLAPSAWGAVWLILVALMCALPNAQWANLKYESFDIRAHVGMGGGSMCSAQFESDMAWATEPNRSACTTEALEACASSKMPMCSNATFSDMAGANSHYEAYWHECRAKCSTEKWEEHCRSLTCGGSRHLEQCGNVTKEVERDYAVAYKPFNSTPALAWSQGDRCRPVSDFCDNGSMLRTASSLAWAGFICTAIGQFCLLMYCMKSGMFKAFQASIALFVVAWIVLLSSWASFANGFNKEATCTVVDAVAWGCGAGASPSSLCAVTATGKFKDIINYQGSYTYGFVIGAWLLLTVVLALELWHLATALGFFGNGAESAKGNGAESAKGNDFASVAEVDATDVVAPDPRQESFQVVRSWPAVASARGLLTRMASLFSSQAQPSKQADEQAAASGENVITV